MILLMGVINSPQDVVADHDVWNEKPPAEKTAAYKCDPGYHSNPNIETNRADCKCFPHVGSAESFHSFDAATVYQYGC